MKRILIGTVMAFGLFAQTAEVHDLLPAESAEGVRLNRAMEESKAAYEGWASRMAHKYIDQHGCEALNGNHATCYKGEFSEGFKHIVPTLPIASPNNCLVGSLCVQPWGGVRPL